jgi:hypothetical protein
VSTLDPSSPAHVEALRWACSAWATHPAECQRAVWLGRDATRAISQERLDAVIALSSPALSASLLRALLERCGCSVGGALDDVQIAPCVDLGLTVWMSIPGDWDELHVSAADISALILALLDIPADAPDRRERAMAALKEPGQ